MVRITASRERIAGVFRLCLMELRDGSDLILRGIEFQIVGAANRKALRPMAIVVKETCILSILILTLIIDHALCVLCYCFYAITM